MPKTYIQFQEGNGMIYMLEDWTVTEAGAGEGKRQVMVTRKDGVKQHYWMSNKEIEEAKAKGKKVEEVEEGKEAPSKKFDSLTVDEIEKIASDNKDDVCQLGVELAGKYAKTDDEYDDIWTAAQDVFDDEMEGKPYSLKDEQTRKDYSKKLLDYLKSGKHKGTAVQDDVPTLKGKEKEEKPESEGSNLTPDEKEERDNLTPNAMKIYDFLRGEGMSHDEVIDQLGEYSQWGEIPGIESPLGKGEPVDNKIRKLFKLPEKKEYPTHEIKGKEETPKTASNYTARNYVQQLQTLMGSSPNSPQAHFYKWTLDKGNEFNVGEEASPKTEEFMNKLSFKPKIKECYYNSFMASIDNPELKYYEGWVVRKDLPIPIEQGR